MEAGVKVFAVALTATVLNAVLKRNTPELAILLGLCAGMWILWSVAEGAAEIAALAAHMVEQTGLGEELLAPVAKTVVCSVVTRITAELCRSAGEQGTAAFVELAGTVLALLASLPLIRAVTLLMTEMLL
jgi:stage III sporulation protein AD